MYFTYQDSRSQTKNGFHNIHKMENKIELNTKNIIDLDIAMHSCFYLLSILKSKLKKSDMKRLKDIERYSNELLKLKNMNK